MFEKAGTWTQKSASLKDDVYHKLDTEFSLYKEWLLCKEKEEILSYSSAYIDREDALAAFDDAEFEDDELERLLCVPDLLSKVVELRRKDAVSTRSRLNLFEEDFRKILESAW